MAESGVCRSCGAPILWIKDQAGTRVPLNTKRVRMYRTAEAGKPDRFLSQGGEPVLAYTSHFVTCPDATQHSRSTPR